MGRQENEIAEINTVIEQIDDPREGYRIVREHIAEHQSPGQHVPADLMRMERLLVRGMQRRIAGALSRRIDGQLSRVDRGLVLGSFSRITARRAA